MRQALSKALLNEDVFTTLNEGEQHWWCIKTVKIYAAALLLMQPLFLLSASFVFPVI